MRGGLEQLRKEKINSRFTLYATGSFLQHQESTWDGVDVDIGGFARPFAAMPYHPPIL